LGAGFVSLQRLGDFERGAVEFIATDLLLNVFYLVACFLSLRYKLNNSGSRSRLALIWGAALTFRLLLVGMSPNLSEDLYRYRWQGRVQAAGGNPYGAIPEEPRWAALEDETWDKVNRKDLPSVYGPALELVHAGWQRTAEAATDDPFLQAWSYKLPFALVELLAAYLLMRLLVAWGRPPEQIVIWLWSPLVCIEFWAQGHNDTLAVAAVVGALLAARRNRWPIAFAALSFAVLTKFWPAVLFPFFLLQSDDGGRWRFRAKDAWTALPVAALLVSPYWRELANVSGMLEGFVGGWRNNDSLYGLIYAWAGDDFALGTVWTSRLLAISLVALWSLRLPLESSARWAIVLLLFFSANCFPWYLSWLLPFLTLAPNAALLLWTALAPLAYHILIEYGILGVWQDSDEIRRLEYGPVFALLAAQALLRSPARPIGLRLLRRLGVLRARELP